MDQHHLMTTAKGNRRSRGAKLHLSFESMGGAGLGMVMEFNCEWLDLPVAFVANMPAFRGYLEQSGFNQLLCWDVVKLDDIQNLECRVVPYQPRDTSSSYEKRSMSLLPSLSRRRWKGGVLTYMCDTPSGLKSPA
jgi:hypothetical protein